MKNMLKKVVIASMLATAAYPLFPVNTNLASANSDYIGDVSQPKYKTIATYYMDANTVKDLAANMKRFSSNSAILVETIAPMIASRVSPVLGGMLVQFL